MAELILPTLLVVTDNPSIRYWVKKELEKEFFVIEAATEESACSAAHSAALDFIIVDSEFEPCDPLDLCRELKQILRTLTPILLITGRLKKSYLDAAIEAGVTDFLNKQLDPEELQSRVRTIRKTRAMRDKTHEVAGALSQKKEKGSSTLKNRVFRPKTQAIKVLEEAKKEGIPVAVLIIQIDHFKEEMSEILGPFTDLIQRFSQNDLLLPSAEGSFLFLLKNGSPEKGNALAEQIRKEISKTPFKAGMGKIHLTVSIAVSSLEGSETDFNRMVESSTKTLKKAQDLIISIDKEIP